MKILIFTEFSDALEKCLPTLVSTALVLPYPVLYCSGCFKQVIGKNELFFNPLEADPEEALITTTRVIGTIKPDIIFMCKITSSTDPSLNTGDLLLNTIHSDERLVRLSMSLTLPHIKTDKNAKKPGIFKVAKRMGNIPCITIDALSNLSDEKSKDVTTHRLDNFMTSVMPLILSHPEEFTSFVDKEIQALITKHQLEPHPAGGHYRQTHCTKDLITTTKGKIRTAGTSMELLLTKQEYSGWQILDADEPWYFHQGDPLLLHIISPVNRALQTIELGGKDGVQYTIPKGHIFACETAGDYTLSSCAVFPGFEYAGYRFVTQTEMETILSDSPALLPLARRLVRE